MPAATATKPARSTLDTVADWPYRFDVLPLSKLVIDAYQRPLTSFVDKVEKKFNPALLGTLAVSERKNGTYAVMDGQTRAEGMRRRGMDKAPCLVFEGLTPQQEAELFALFATERRGMTSASRFIAEVFGQKEPAVFINKIVEDAGYRIDPNRNPDGDTIPAVAALEFVYRGAKSSKRSKPEPELLIQTLDVIKQTWPPPHPLATSSDIIRGLGYFLSTEQNVNQERLIARLRRVQPSELARRAENLREGRGMSGKSPMYLAEAIASEYKRSGRR